MCMYLGSKKIYCIYVEPSTILFVHECSHWLALQAFCIISFDPFDKTAGNYINTAKH
jgi:hypothetical protein